MAVAWEDLRDFMNASNVPQEKLERLVALADALLAPVWEQAYREVPEAVKDEVALELGQALYKRNQTPAGQVATSDGVVNVPRDPMAFVWPIIRKYVGWL